jgi:hypothetical protein
LSLCFGGRYRFGRVCASVLLLVLRSAVVEQLIPFIVQLIGGAAGGNIVGALLKNLNLSKVIATIAGIVGGIGGGQLAGMTGLLEQILGATAGDGAEIAGQGGAAAIGGALLTAIVGFIKKAMDKTA